MRTVFWMAVAFLSLIIASPIHAMEPWGVLDDFSGNLINDSIWNTSTSTNAGVTEFAREQQAGKVRLL